jgi:hypothetical protein
LNKAFDTSFNLSPGGFVEEFIVNARDNAYVFRNGHHKIDKLNSKSEALGRTYSTLAVKVFCCAVKDRLLMWEDVLVPFSFNSFFTVRKYTVRKEVDEV